MPHRLRKLPRIWAPETSLLGSYTRFIDFLTPFLPILVIKRPLNRPFPLPAHRIFTDFCSRFVKGISGAPRGGIMSLEGVKFSKRFKLPTDLFHHTHEVWGPCSYKNTSLRRHGPRVLASYCGLPLFWPPFFDFAPLWHDHSGHNIILVLNTLRRGPPAAARTLQLVFLHNFEGLWCTYSESTLR